MHVQSYHAWSDDDNEALRRVMMSDCHRDAAGAPRWLWQRPLLHRGRGHSQAASLLRCSPCSPVCRGQCAEGRRVPRGRSGAAPGARPGGEPLLRGGLHPGLLLQPGGGRVDPSWKVTRMQKTEMRVGLRKKKDNKVWMWRGNMDGTVRSWIGNFNIVRRLYILLWCVD